MKRILFFILSTFFIPIFSNSNAQIITTVAGNTLGAYAGDGGPAIAAEIQCPYAVTLDASNNIYIADRYNNVIRKVNTSGIISTVAGNNSEGYNGDGIHATDAMLDNPCGVAVDGAGNIFIADMLNHCIRKVTASTGIISTYAGYPMNPGYNGDGDLAAATTTLLDWPMGIALDASGNLYIADLNNNVIRKVTASTGIISTFAGSFAGFAGDGGAASSARLNQPVDVKCDAGSNVYIADYYNYRIRKVNSSGIITTIAGNGIAGYSGDGGPATLAKLNRPTGVALNSNGVLFISDGLDNRIRTVYPTGVIYTLAGNGIAGYLGDGGIAHYAEISSPYSGVIDASGNFLVADANNNVIRKITPFINHLPVFTHGATQSLNLCNASSAYSLNTMLGITETDTTQTENWTVLHSPAHGTLSASYTAVSSGTSITPTGLTYTPSLSYVGLDTFKIRVCDGIGYDTTTVYLTIDSFPPTAVISGIDSICLHGTRHLSASVSGGIWSTSNVAIDTVNDTGTVYGVSAGTDSIIYTKSNICGSSIALMTFRVLPDTCVVYIDNFVNNFESGIKIIPNPNNGVFSISVNSAINENIQVTLLNITGEKVKEFSLEANVNKDIQLDVADGVYLVVCTTSTNRYYKKVVVKR